MRTFRLFCWDDPPDTHAITNIVEGNEPGVRAELHKLDLEPDDTILLCSDGLTEMVSDERIAAILQEEQGLQRVWERLVAEANEKGGADNVTVIAGRFEAPRGKHHGGGDEKALLFVRRQFAFQEA